MAVHDLGYRAWSGQTVPPRYRLTVIAATGVRRAWQSGWLRRMLLFAWLPAIWFGFGFFVWEQALLYPEWQARTSIFVGELPLSNQLADAIRNSGDDPVAARHAFWAWMLQSLFRYPQAVLMVMVVGIVSPGLISQDIRSRAFLLYFSRPLNRTEYVLGKLMTLWFYLAIISTLPALILYALGVLLSPQLQVVLATWDLPFRILLASGALMVPTGALALCLSSMTQESRYAAFAWFALWILGWFTYAVMTVVRTMEPSGQPAPIEPGRWHLVSMYHTLGRVQSWIFGFDEFAAIADSAVLLTVTTLISLAIVLRRVAAPMRV